MSLLLLLRTPDTVECEITLSDEVGNPLPPLLRVDFFPEAARPDAMPSATAYVGASSIVAVQLVNGAAYRALVSGALVASTIIFFHAAPSVSLVVAPYVSPSQTQANYAYGGTAASIGGLYPRGRLPQSALKPNGVAYRLFYALAAVYAEIDGQLRGIGASERLDSSKEAQVDSWSTDFLGSTLLRQPNETDAAYIARIRARLQLPFGTLPAVKLQVAAFFALFPGTSLTQDVFDRQSDPPRSARYGLTPGQFAVIEYAPSPNDVAAFHIGQDFIGQTGFLRDPNGFTKSFEPPFPLLGEFVNAAKRGGSVPVYIASSGEPTNLGKWTAPWETAWGSSSAP